MPDLNLLIEFDGEQHYRPIARFGGTKKHLGIKKRDEIKTSFTKERGFNFLRIPYTHIRDINAILNNNITLIKSGKHVSKELKPKSNSKKSSLSIEVKH